ncbi:tetratricopeptide repeat protein [Nitrosomonas communis]|uniref:Tfp pilus assembly protein PilF n=1 Tax=Nitrosomonas communis TaxID=44574 RepID=A0A1I4L1V8_9PROT|nr:tetratricopeptide repeat protein [Nitrosomonas communis]SFL84866.1 Tfp pilus assembly protein PilF [Nitrosomonas communis]
MFQWNAKTKNQTSEVVEQNSNSINVDQETTTSIPTTNKNIGKFGGGKDLNASFEAAQGLIKAKRFDEAQQVFETILKKNPDVAAAYVGLGNILAAKKQYDDALEHYSAALHVKKNFVPALIMSGNVYARQNLNEKAIEKFKESININPAMVNASLGLSRVYAKTGRHEDAIDCLKKVLEQNPQLEVARLMLARIYQRKGLHDVALQETTKATTSNPDSWQAFLSLAKLLVAQGNYKQAITACQSAIDLKSDNAQLHCIMGRSYAAMGEYDLALKAFKIANEIAPRLLAAKLGIARMYLEQNNLSEGKKILVELSKGNRNLGEVHRLLAEIMMRQNLYADAIDEFKAAIFHGKDLEKKYPELLSIPHRSGEEQQTAKAYKEIFDRIVTSSSIKQA